MSEIERITELQREWAKALGDEAQRRADARIHGFTVTDGEGRRIDPANVAASPEELRANTKA